MSDSTEPEKTADNDALQQALQRARSSSTPTGTGPAKATLALGGAVLVGAGFLGGYFLGGHGGGDQQMRGGFNTHMDGPGGGPGGPNGRPLNLTIGTIKSISGNVVTLKSDAGDTVKVKIAGSTEVRVTKKGSIKDLSKGDNIVVHGQRDGDTITADNVNAGGMFRVGPGKPGGPGGPAGG